MKTRFENTFSEEGQSEIWFDQKEIKEGKCQIVVESMFYTYARDSQCGIWDYIPIMIMYHYDQL